MATRVFQPPLTRGPWPPAAYRRMSDEELAHRAGLGEEQAFASLYERYQRPLYRYCYSILNDAEDARDALQTVMLSAYREFARNQRSLDVRAWLFRVAQNASVSMVRRRKPQVELHEDSASCLAESESLDVRDRLERALGDLSSLTPHTRDALVMRAFQGLAYEEIGDRLAISPGAARQAVFEARSALEQSERGRDMDCDSVRGHLATGDRRRLRNRMISVHLTACDSCQRLTGQIRTARHRLAAVPSIVVLGRSWIVDLFSRVDPAGLTGVKAAAVGLAALTVGTGVWASHDLSSPRPVQAAAATSTPSNRVATVEGGPTSVVVDAAPPSADGSTSHGIDGAAGSHAAGATPDSPSQGDSLSPSADPTTIASPEAGPFANGAPETTPNTEAASAPGDGGTDVRDNPPPNASTPPSPTEPAVSPDSPGNSGTAPGQSDNPPGHGGTPPGQGGTPPGQSGDPPGQSGGAPGNSENAPGQSGASPGQSDSAPGHAGGSPGSSNAGGNGGNAGDEAPGNSGNAPGHTGQTGGSGNGSAAH